MVRAVWGGLALLALGSTAWAQEPERTIDDIRIEAQARAERGTYPTIGEAVRWTDPVIFRKVIMPWEPRMRHNEMVSQ